MASRKDIARKKISKTKTKSLTQAQELMAIGDAPKMKDFKSQRLWIMKSFNWLNALYGADDFKSFFLKYIENMDIDSSKYSKHPSYDFCTIGKISWLLTDTIFQDEYLLGQFDKYLSILDNQVVIKAEQEVKSEEHDEEKVTIRHKYIDEYMGVYTELDQTMFTEKWSEEDLMKYSQFNAVVLNKLKSHYEDHYKDAHLSLDKKSKDYKYWKKRFDTAASNSQTFFELLDRLLLNTKNKRISRKTTKRKPNYAKMVQKVVYMKSDPQLKLESIEPISVIGKTHLMVYNTKTRKFGIFKASEEGFSFKGTTLHGYIEDESVCKTLRKPQTQISDLLQTTIKGTLKKFGDVKAVSTKMNGRFNKYMLLLKVV